jgi:hypothetical protein
VNTDFQWIRIAMAMGLMGLAYLVLPAYFLWHDNRVAERARARSDAATETAGATSSSTSTSEDSHP